jgi:hypothetical protein
MVWCYQVYISELSSHGGYCYCRILFVQILRKFSNYFVASFSRFTTWGLGEYSEKTVRIQECKVINCNSE